MSRRLVGAGVIVALCWLVVGWGGLSGGPAIRKPWWTRGCAAARRPRADAGPVEKDREVDESAKADDPEAVSRAEEKGRRRPFQYEYEQSFKPGAYVLRVLRLERDVETSSTRCRRPCVLFARQGCDRVKL